MTTFRSDDRYAVVDLGGLVGVAQRGDLALSWVFARPGHEADLAELWVSGAQSTVWDMCAEVQAEMRACGWLAEDRL